MPKAKLKIDKKMGKQFKTACGINDIKVGAATPIPGDQVLTEVIYNSAQQLWDTAVLMPSLKGDELDPKEEKGK